MTHVGDASGTTTEARVDASAGGVGAANASPGDTAFGGTGDTVLVARAADSAHPGTVPAAATAGAHSSAADLPGSDTEPVSHSPGPAMDMADLCLAILATGLLAGLLRAALSRRAEWLVGLRQGAVAVMRANPPPRRPDLAQLSILRI
ncbi:hypothetical protein [Streptomyces albipurpureus]|uniref:Uncharacterized protein n=1 Tax=Streptomyces albipurpureus TaxID=2897419 RepID=A0ABT0UG91_9ACTN|nr:hypothetical protein [Streptomyces sp. CWNU-1]MCM2387649.1 hypothetical protein [Streptomyces sp. CWNU-1]